MGRKVLKAGRGIQLGDVANSAIRNILTALGNDLYGKFDWEKQEETLKFFDYYCPYTGRLLVDPKTNEWIGDIALDHIVPINKDECGLNVMGNFLVVDKKANGEKGKKTVEDFLRNNDGVLAGIDVAIREARLTKIKEFQKKYNCDCVQIKNSIEKELLNIYSETQQFLRDRLEKIKKVILVGEQLDNFITEQEKNTVEKIKVNTKELIDELRYVLESCRFTEEEIANFTRSEYTKETWGISTYPLLVRDREPQRRYYSKPVIIKGEKYYLCNHWLSQNKEKLVVWLESYKEERNSQNVVKM